MKLKRILTILITISMLGLVGCKSLGHHHHHDRDGGKSHQQDGRR